MMEQEYPFGQWKERDMTDLEESDDPFEAENEVFGEEQETRESEDFMRDEDRYEELLEEGYTRMQAANIVNETAQRRLRATRMHW